MFIERPIITEKSMAQAQTGVYTFAVDPRRTKPAIARAIEELYKVTVDAVRVQSVKGKAVRRKKGLGRQRDWKKALITVKMGQAIKDFALPEAKPTPDDQKKIEAKQKTDKPNQLDKVS